MRILRKIIGRGLVISPLVGLLVLAGMAKGWLFPFVMLGLLAAVAGVTVLGLWIAED